MTQAKSGTQADISGDDFLNAIQAEPQRIEVKAGVFVTLRPLTFSEVQQIVARNKGDANGMAFDALVTGLLIPQLSAEQVDRMRNAPAGPLMKAAKQVMMISGMVDDDPNSDGVGDGS